MEGTFTALITPFTKELKIDYHSLHKMIEHQIEGGIDGIVPCGTTGESPTLSHSEHNEVVRFVHEKVAGRAKVIAGTGSNSTLECISMSQKAEKTGVDALLVVSPYYNKPTQQGLYQHYKAVADSVGIEIIVYHIPGRTSSSISLDTFGRLAEIKNITTVKEATSSIDFANALMHTAPHLSILSGNDSLNYPLYACGAHGCISVLSNPYPKIVKKMKTLVDNGDYKQSLDIHRALWAIGETMFVESNPIPVKSACHAMGLIETPEVRLPLVSCTEETTKKLKSQIDTLEAYFNKN